MYCVIQEIELKKQNTSGACRSLEAYKTNWTMNGEDMGSYNYRYTGGTFERPIKKAYKISMHHSYRENGLIKKKQWSICTMSYYDIADGSTWIQDYIILSRWSSLLEDMDITEDEFCSIVYKKLDPLINQIQEEFKQTAEYKTHQDHRQIINKYLEDKNNFQKTYNSDTYDNYYDVFGVLRETEKLRVFKKQYEAAQEQKRSYYENFQSNYNNFDFGSYFNTKQSNYTDKEKEYLKKIYRSGAKALHPDTTGDNEGMQFLNKLKEQWGI